MVGWVLAGLGALGAYSFWRATHPRTPAEVEKAYGATRILQLLDFAPYDIPPSSIMTARVLVPHGSSIIDIQKLFDKSTLTQKLIHGAAALPQVAIVESRVAVPGITVGQPTLYADVVDARAQSDAYGEKDITQARELRDLAEIEPIAGQEKYQLAAALYHALAVQKPVIIMIGVRDVEPLPMGKLAGARFVRF